MAYRLSLNEAVSTGLQRILREELRYALGQLCETDAATRDECVHEARKSIKKMRAVLRLVEGGNDSQALLRDTGRILSTLRDAAALVETADALLERSTGEAYTALLKALRRLLVRRQRTAEGRQNPATVMLQAAAALEQFEQNLSAWPALPQDFEAVADGWKRSYRRGRQALAEARANPGPEAFHELRKAVKNHWYHIRLVGNVWPETMLAREKCLKELQEWLGDDHNLAILSESIGIRYRPLLPLVQARQGELRSASLALAARVYAEKPGDHVRSMKSLWNQAS